MARMHARKRGKSGSTKPPVKTTPAWVDTDKRECEKLIKEFGEKGMTASAIGVKLRDQYGVPNAKTLTGKTVSQILKENKLEQKLPEDMMSLIKKAVFLRKHLEKNAKDVHNKRGLQLVESKIRRLQKYYKGKSRIPKNWYYNAEEAALLVK